MKLLMLEIIIATILVIMLSVDFMKTILSKTHLSILEKITTVLGMASVLILVVMTVASMILDEATYHMVLEIVFIPIFLAFALSAYLASR